MTKYLEDIVKEVVYLWDKDAAKNGINLTVNISLLPTTISRSLGSVAMPEEGSVSFSMPKELYETLSDNELKAFVIRRFGEEIADLSAAREQIVNILVATAIAAIAGFSSNSFLIAAGSAIIAYCVAAYGNIDARDEFCDPNNLAVEVTGDRAAVISCIQKESNFRYENSPTFAEKERVKREIAKIAPQGQSASLAH